MADTQHSKKYEELHSPVNNLRAVTPNDVTDLAEVARCIFVGVSGDINVIAGNDDTAVVVKNVAAGVPIPIRAKRILATNTTATDIVIGY